MHGKAKCITTLLEQQAHQKPELIDQFSSLTKALPSDQVSEQTMTTHETKLSKEAGFEFKGLFRVLNS